MFKQPSPSTTAANSSAQALRDLVCRDCLCAGAAVDQVFNFVVVAIVATGVWLALRPTCVFWRCIDHLNGRLGW